MVESKDDFKLTPPKIKCVNLDTSDTHVSMSAMPFVKIDTGILNSSLWVERDVREIFLTALLMAEPKEFDNPLPQYEVDSLEETGFVVPPGWYGFVSAAGSGIVRRALLDKDSGMAALKKLGQPDPESRSEDYDGRRLVRIDHGFVVLNYMKYRERDYGNAERCKRWRNKKKEETTRMSNDATCMSDMQAEADTSVPPQAVELADSLKKWILRNNPSAKVGDAQVSSWAKQADLMMRLDSRPSSEALSLIEWCQQDSFWSANILSMQKFRKQYDQLSMKRKNGASNGNHPAGHGRFEAEREQLRRVVRAGRS